MFLASIDDYKKLNNIIYHGVDLSNVRVQCANNFVNRFIKTLKREVDLSFDVQDLEKLPFKDQEYDLTLIPSVLERVDEQGIKKVIKEICRVTKDDIYISDSYDQYPRGYPSTPKQLEKIFSQYGLPIVNEHYKFTTSERDYCELHLHLHRIKNT